MSSQEILILHQLLSLAPASVIIVGLVEWIKTIEFKSLGAKVTGYITPIVAVAIGAAAGVFGLGGLDITSGVVIGLGAVGLHASIKAAGGN